MDWKVNDLVVVRENKITDIGIINGFQYLGDDQYADILILYSEYSPIHTFVHAPKDCVHVIGNIKTLSNWEFIW